MSPKIPAPTTRPPKPATSVFAWALAGPSRTPSTPARRPSCATNRQLMMALLNDRLPIAKIVNAKAISHEDAPKAYAEFDEGIAAKFVLDPHDMLVRRR